MKNATFSYWLAQWIRKEQSANEIKMMQLDNGHLPLPRCKRYEAVDRHLLRLKTQYENQERTIMEYVDIAIFDFL